MACSALAATVDPTIGVGKVRGQDTLEFGVHGAQVPRVRHLDPGLGVVGAAGQELSGEGRGEEGQRRRVVDVVLDEHLGQDDRRGDRDIDDAVRLHLGRAELRQLGLGVGVDPHEDVLSDGEMGDLGHLGLDGHFVGAPRIGETTRDDRHPILVEAVAVVAPQAVAGGRRERLDGEGGTVSLHRDHVDARCALHPLDMGQSGDGVQDGRAVAQFGSP